MPKPISVPVPIFTPVPAVARTKRESHKSPSVDTLLLHILPAVPAVPTVLTESDNRQLIFKTSPKTGSKRIIFEDSSVEVLTDSDLEGKSLHRELTFETLLL